MFKLLIGSKNFSSWSLRPWLVLRMLDEPFEEHLVPLYQADTTERLQSLSPSAKVPVLFDRQLRIWDSLAICEYLAECFPAARLWPDETPRRALARSVVAEMHAGFGALRSELPMDVCRSAPAQPRSAACEADIRRIATLWEDLRSGHLADGPFLFGHFTIADAFFAPVAFRFASYGVTLDGLAQAYQHTLLGLPAMQDWAKAARSETQPASA
ncbi:MULTISPECIES: glutathione S-transferase family protein [Gulbenkiania]|uniref:Glutathione S-transferase n=2 Tax=Gulbenkiania TaxID=397456 RepID=A0A0K6H719_9NEIS|nr:MULTISPECIES: glutathione S-transferase family protein [Gulbenkiania]TCW29645.1 glutathione S-transferase [Gulbenkiania mobilis]CUA86782.1 Glutathione S-transferase [Gulbenkiania indica]